MATRNITSIVAGTGKYTITVDEDFPYAIGATEQNSSEILPLTLLKDLEVLRLRTQQ